MFDVNSIGSSVSATTLREYVNQSIEKRGGDSLSVLDDSVEISDLADLLSRLAELPEDRARKIVDIRKALDEGSYESPQKLDVATERLLRDISKSKD